MDDEHVEEGRERVLHSRRNKARRRRLGRPAIRFDGLGRELAGPNKLEYLFCRSGYLYGERGPIVGSREERSDLYLDELGARLATNGCAKS